jgi:asparagine N-glycosylation enzyme membrane subunit Stt3
MLVLAPVMCILSGIAVSSILEVYIKNVDTSSVTSADVAGAAPKTVAHICAFIWSIHVAAFIKVVE